MTMIFFLHFFWSCVINQVKEFLEDFENIFGNYELTFIEMIINMLKKNIEIHFLTIAIKFLYI